MKLKLLSLLLLLPTFVFAKQIDTNTALIVAGNFMDGKQENLGARSLSSQLELAYIATNEGQQLRSAGEPRNYYYIFNKGNDSGFIIVAADDVMPPVLGYTSKGNYSNENQAPAFIGWTDGLKYSIEKTITEGKQSSAKIQNAWNNLLDPAKARTITEAKSVQPLIKTIWGQTHPYNFVNPHKVGLYPPTGCVATAMGQIMKYYEYPVSGKRATETYTTYTHKYKEKSVDITQYQYDWAIMKDEYHGYEPETDASMLAVSNLLYHCGLAVKMDYADASGAMSENAALAFSKYFDYEPTRVAVSYDYSQTEWENIIKNELNNSRPVLFGGRSNEGDTHAFVCDGYEEKEGLFYFHFNYGWTGNQDGFYLLTDPNKFPKNQHITYNIKPRTASSPENNWAKISSIESRRTSVESGFPFTVRVKYIDKQSLNRVFDYDIVLCNDENQIVARVNVEDSFFGYDKFCMLSFGFAQSGTYKIRAVYGGTDTFVETADDYKEVYITVLPTKEGVKVVLTADVTASPTYVSMANYLVSIKTSYQNMGTLDFNGYMGIALVDNAYMDGYFVKHILDEKPVTIPAGAPPVDLSYQWIFGDNLAYCGQYDVLIVVKENAEDEWTFLDDDTNINPYGYFRLSEDGGVLRGLSPRNIVIADKFYDGTLTATVADWGSLSGYIVPGDNVRLKQSSFLAEFDIADAGNSRNVKLKQSIELEGASAHKYFIKDYDNVLSFKANINKAPLTIKAQNVEMEEGSDPSTLDLSEAYEISGFVASENENIMAIYPQVSIHNSITSTTPVGVYADKVIVSEAMANNYDITFVPGTLTIKPNTPVGIENGQEDGLSFNIYPNPVNKGNSVTVEMPVTDAEGGVINVYTMTGVSLSSTKVQGSHTIVNMPSVSGVYMLSCSNNGRIVKHKLIIVK